MARKNSVLKNIPIKKLIAAAQDLGGADKKSVRVDICIDATAPQAAADAVRRLFTPVSDRGRVHIEEFGEVAYQVAPDAGLLVIVAGRSDALSRTVAQAVVTDKPVVVCAADSKGVYERSQRTSFPLEPTDIVDMDAVHNYAAFEKSLAAWIVDNDGCDQLALAANFAFLRRPLAVDCRQRTALECGVVAAVPLIPGADMPVLIALQGKMILQIAAAFGRPISTDTIVEVAVTLPTAFGARTLARSLCKRFPHLAWVMRGLTAYGITSALGAALTEFFARGGLPANISQALDDARQRIGGLGGGAVEAVVGKVFGASDEAEEGGGDRAAAEEPGQDEYLRALGVDPSEVDGHLPAAGRLGAGA